VDNVPQHFASIFADKSAVRTSDWWDTPQKDVFLDHGVVEFSIPKAKAAVTISGVSTELRGAALDTSRHEPQIPKLRSINQNFVLDTKKPETIAEMWVRQGTLTACNFGGAVVSQLTSGYDGTIRIEAKLGGQTKFIELNNDAEIVLSNTSDLFKPKSRIRCRKTITSACTGSST